ncbi:MAG: beta-ketoacyl-ACP synthase III [Planctomycetota bacterium]|nr:beta-ketoacyl-ACP synthase III [Planctomycetota bacterium]
MSGQAPFGVRIAGTGSAVPSKVLANTDLEQMIDPSSDWIVKRTGIHQRHILDQERGETTLDIERRAITAALDAAGMTGADLDLLIVASLTSEMRCPSNACRLIEAIGAQPAGAFDLNAACCGFVYSLNIADSLIRSGRHRAIGIVGCDTLSRHIDYTERTVSILFGDAAGAAVVVRDDEHPERGCIYQKIEADGRGWESLYMPRREEDVPPAAPDSDVRMGYLRMNGREVYKFAVSKFQYVIEDALEQTGLKVDDIAQFVCHQSNIRIIESAKEKIGLPDDKVYINIDKYGNSSAGSVGLCLDELMQQGRINPGDKVVFVAFGAGMTWSSSVWQV